MSTQTSLDISIVLTAHREGLLAHPALSSALKARACAEAAGISVELIVTLDDPDPQTHDYFSEAAVRQDASRFAMLRTTYRDLAAARNNAIAAARGQFIGLLDGDDLWCSEWLVAAYRAAQSDRRRIAWHPQYSIVFGDENGVLITRDMEDPGFRLLSLCIDNHWSALAFAERAIFLETPYRPTNFESSGFGYEDWTWNCDTIARGVLHKVVPATSHFIRKKGSGASLSWRTAAGNGLPIPSDLFRVGPSMR